MQLGVLSGITLLLLWLLSMRLCQPFSVSSRSAEEANALQQERPYQNVCQLKCCACRQIALIRDWRDILTEVGDHQSLVASLKQAAYHHLFKASPSLC